MNLLKYTRNSTSVQYLHGPTGHGQDIYPETRDASRLNLATRLLSLLRGPCGLRFYCWKVFSVSLSLYFSLSPLFDSPRFRPLYTLFHGKKRKGVGGWGKEKKWDEEDLEGIRREREGKAVFLEGRSGLIFRILFGRGGFLLIEVYPQGRKSEGFYEASLLWIYFERGGTRKRWDYFQKNIYYNSEVAKKIIFFSIDI